MIITAGDKISLYLIRHGQSVANTNREKIGGSSEDSQLTDLGKSQAAKLGDYFTRKNICIDTIYSSTFIRAIQTAKIFAEKIGFDEGNITMSDKLVELDQGDWSGKLRREVYTPEVLNLIQSQQNFFIPPGGESKAQVIHRTSTWLLEEILVESQINKHIAVVFHGFAIKCLLQYIMGFNDSMIYNINTGNTSVTKLTYSSRGWGVNYLNSMSHLE
jgi:broad specificity phosphatase PhoE